MKYEKYEEVQWWGIHAKNKASTPGGGAGQINSFLYQGEVRYLLLWRPNYKAPVK